MTTTVKFSNQKKLGPSGVFVSELCLGTMTFAKSNTGRKDYINLDSFESDLLSMGTSSL
eukprot:TRINITY_DN45292_c0_g1_i1.p1 TRINITY_DN45292_c0_g1~~TRINITY_DN45292_c0_g1_i1.p1  ORF type:complete len:67 (-),score=0.33 TRINITY_DN45292_c0_g1_i1:29-205(-)